MIKLKPKNVDDFRSWTTKEELMEALAELPDGAKIYEHMGDEERSHGYGHIVASADSFSPIRTKEEACPCRDYMELVMMISKDDDGEAGWLLH